MAPKSIEIRNVSDDELAAYLEALFTTFGDDATVDPNGDARLRALIPSAQRWAAFEGSLVVATAATFDLAIGIPGGTLPMAGLTMVSVRPTHRRRGLMRQLVQRHLDDARVRGFAINGLWATEAEIYGRFGFGIATHADVIGIQDASTLALRDTGPRDDLEWIDEARAREVLPEIYAQAIANRPGALRRSEVWWRERRFLETPFKRAGASKRRHVMVHRDGRPTGYLVYRQRGAFEASRPNGKVEIVELLGCDSRAVLSLWRFALQVDLYPNVSWWNAPVDDPLAWVAIDARRVMRRRTDSMWLRIENVAGALAARTYDADGTLQLGLDGACFELAVAGARGICTRTDRPAELELSPAALASAYLGGVSFTELAQAELVRGEAGAIARADRMFASPIAPWCPEVF